jgi:hypothetical protein
MDDWILWATLTALVCVAVRLWAMAFVDDRKRHREDAEGGTWVRYPTNPTDQAYNAWLNEHDLSTWPYEVDLQPGYDERKESA